MITPTIFLQVFYSPRWKTGRYISQGNLNHFWIWDYLQLLTPYNLSWAYSPCYQAWGLFVANGWKSNKFNSPR